MVYSLVSVAMDHRISDDDRWRGGLRGSNITAPIRDRARVLIGRLVLGLG